jgi:uncharacterized protein DUF4386
MADGLHVIDSSQRTAAKVVGLAYLIPVAFMVYANFGMVVPLFVKGDMAETMRRIASAESLFRLGVAFEMVYCIGVVVLLAALYVVLSPVSRHLAVLASALKMVYAVTAVLMVLSLLNVVRLATDAAYQQGVQPETLQALVRMNYSATGMQYYVGLAFWASSATVFGWLWLRSGYIPRALAVIGIVSAAWCVLCTFAYIINPAFSRVVNLWWFDSPFALFDITLSFWLLFKGLRDPAAAPA